MGNIRKKSSSFLDRMLCMHRTAIPSASTTHLVVLAFTRPSTTAPRHAPLITPRAPRAMTTTTSKQAATRRPCPSGRRRTDEICERACAPSAGASAAVRRSRGRTAASAVAIVVVVDSGGRRDVERLQVDVRLNIIVTTVIRVGCRKR